MNNNVSIGPTSVIGWITGGLLAAPAMIEEVVALLENSAFHLSSGSKVLVILGVAKLAIVAVGRYIQALKNPNVVPTELEPAAPSSLAGESARTPDGAQAEER